MRDVLRLANASVWRELESVENGLEIGAKSQTAVAGHLENELFRRAAGHAPSRFYALFRADGSVSVCLRAGDDGPPTSPTGTIVTGLKNANPFPTYDEEIQALALHLEVSLGPANYPHSRGWIR